MAYTQYHRLGPVTKVDDGELFVSMMINYLSWWWSIICVDDAYAKILHLCLVAKVDDSAPAQDAQQGPHLVLFRLEPGLRSSEHFWYPILT